MCLGWYSESPPAVVLYLSLNYGLGGKIPFGQALCSDASVARNNELGCRQPEKMNNPTILWG